MLLRLTVLGVKVRIIPIVQQRGNGGWEDGFSRTQPTLVAEPTQGLQKNMNHNFKCSSSSSRYTWLPLSSSHHLLPPFSATCISVSLMPSGTNGLSPCLPTEGFPQTALPNILEAVETAPLRRRRQSRLPVSLTGQL